MRARAWIVAVVVALAGGAARAAPPRYALPASPHRNDPALADAEARWAAAARETDRSRAPAAWDAAADAFGKVADDARVAGAVRVEAAQAAVLAVENALATDVVAAPAPRASDDGEPPAARPLDGHARALVAAVTRYLALAPGAADAVRLRFLRGNVLRRSGHLDEAEADFADILEHQRADPIAAYAANLLLDSLNRQRRYDEMLRWVERLRADDAFTKAHPDVAATLARLHDQRLRRHAEDLERTAHATGDPAGYDRCGAAYDAAAADDPDHGEDVLYGAAVCYEMGGSADLAIARYRGLDARFPRSPLRSRVLARLGMLQLRIADVAAAAATDERLARLFPAERDAPDALREAAYLRHALGDLDGAARDVDTWLKMYGRRTGRAQAFDLQLAMARAWLDAGRIARARRVLDPLRAPAGLGRDPDRDAALAQALWDAACPVAPTDGLCLRRGRPARDATRAARARAVLRRLHTPRAALLAADDLLEAALAVGLPPPARRDGAWRARISAAATAARDAYGAIVDAPDADAATRARALARRGRLLHVLAAVDPTLDVDARADFAACVRLAVDGLLADRLAACDDGLRAAGGADEAPRERLPRRPVATLAPGLEGRPLHRPVVPQAR